MGLRCTWESEQGAEFELPDGSSFGLWKLDDGEWSAGSGVMFAVADASAAAAYYEQGAPESPSTPEDTEVCTMAFLPRIAKAIRSFCTRENDGALD